MIAIAPVAVLRRAAVFEIQNDACYHAPSPSRIFLNGEDRGAFNRNVFMLSGLEPGMSYELRAEAGGDTGRCSFVTPPETALVDVRRFGAVGDGVTDCTAALQAAISACEPGGTVLAPEGVYLTYPLFLRSGVLLYLEKGAVLLGGTDRARYPVLPGMVQNPNGTETSYGTWEGNPLDCYASLLTGIGVSGAAVAGEGVVDGNARGADWWRDPKKRRGAWRPRTIFLNRCEDVTLMGITVRNSPSWTIHPYYCRRLDILDVSVNNPPDSPNTDGCNPESCEKVRILGARISVGDDCISVKSGKYYMGVAHPGPSRDILVRNCLLERGHGAVVLGSEVSAGVSGLLVEKCLMRETDRGLRVKTRRGRGKSSVLTGIEFSHIRMENVGAPFVVNMFYYCDPDGHSDYVRSKLPLPVDEGTPAVGTLYCHDIVCTGCASAGCFFYGLPERPVEEIRLENVSVTFDERAEAGLPAMMDDIEPVRGQALFAVNVSALILENVNFYGFEGEEVRCEGVPRCERGPARSEVGDGTSGNANAVAGICG